MSRSRIIKSQSRSSPAVARVSGGSPAVSKVSNGLRRLKIYDKPKTRRNGVKKDKIHFKEYFDLVERSLEKSAKNINRLLSPVFEKEEGRKLRKYSLKDFLTFSKNHYFQKDGFFCVSDNGCLSVDWNVKNHTLVNILFCGNKNNELCILSKDTEVFKDTTVDSISRYLNYYKVPTK